jgi:NOL1/NOP2/fmu family ribosome biogenesis protein
MHKVWNQHKEKLTNSLEDLEGTTNSLIIYSHNIKDNKLVVDLSKEDALKFLKKEQISVENAQNGWILARYQGLNLGFMKIIGNRMNNYLPKEWRIRMDIPE